MIQNQEKKAKECLLRLRGLKTDSIQFKTEFTNMIIYNESKYGKSKNCNNSLLTNGNDEKNIFQKSWSNVKYFLSIFKISEVWKPFVILNTFFFFQQFCGIYVVNAYAVKLISNNGITQDPFQVAVMLGILQICGELGQILTSSR